ncbi:hypothetical protein [Alteromonas sp. ASW11-130]|uniref:hypothetical protein n=1 Tax=Alteromonas sp. ASW11-130 TaxID=3015775 RepID=UPI002242931E|nr:hypothetical protein [Alteromonas sp. ASW11-130]MCW8091145.1 hypothetical protein [Alteromonas sp. ASW11-130]
MKSLGRQLPINIEMEERVVVRPPTWRETPYEISYLLVEREVTSSELVQLLKWAATQGLKNPKVITPHMVRWSSLLHPRFYHAVCKGNAMYPPLYWHDPDLPNDFTSLSRLWLESTQFLAGVTLCAAIIQNRYSRGTIESKLDKLWDAGRLANEGMIPALTSLNLHTEINELVRSQQSDQSKLFALRHWFKVILATLAPQTGQLKTMRTMPLPSEIAERFGFVKALRQSLGHQLHAVIVYGSSVSSTNYADIDVLLIVKHSDEVLKKMAGTSPRWNGKELNMGVYSIEEFITMQQLSGDNLLDYGICIWGEAPVVHKPQAQLLARNFSFGAIRQRQQLGMLARQFSATRLPLEDRTNLHQYFVKIPANVAKGTLGATNQRLSKDQINHWLVSQTDFDMYRAQDEARKGDIQGALASSSLATGKVLSALNQLMSVATARKNRESPTFRTEP